MNWKKITITSNEEFYNSIIARKKADNQDSLNKFLLTIIERGLSYKTTPDLIVEEKLISPYTEQQQKLLKTLDEKHVDMDMLLWVLNKEKTLKILNEQYKKSLEP